jgi:hypothetical protein
MLIEIRYSGVAPTYNKFRCDREKVIEQLFST